MKSSPLGSYQKYTTYGVDQLLSELGTSIDKGLNNQEITQRQEQYGFNELPGQYNAWWRVLFNQFTSPFIYLLVIIGVAAFVLQDKSNALIIFACVLLNAIVGFYQEYKAEQSMRFLKQYLVANVTVIREGAEQEVPSSHLVPGDILLLYPGDIIPADVRIIKEDHLQINESALTGESLSVHKQAAALDKSAQHIFEALNIGFSGTTIESGKGIGVVIATGVHGSLGTIASLTAQSQRVSGFSIEISKFSKFILLMIIATVALVFVMHLIITYPQVDIINLAIFAIALGITIIPEALPVVATFGFTRGALRLAAHKVVVKRLSAIEDLGSIEVLCADKTGTLTENKLTISGVYGPEREVLWWAVLGSGLALRTLGTAKGFDAIIWQALTDEERAVLTQYEKVIEIPFDPVRRRSLTLYKLENKYELIVRGSMMDVLSCCVPLKEGQQKTMDSWIEYEGAKGNRIIAVARKQYEGLDEQNLDIKAHEHDMELVGLISFEDPLKKTAIYAIEKGRQLGVQIKILSGDSPEVCAAIGSKIGLIQNPLQVVPGDYFLQQSYEEKKKLAQNGIVFARITPEQKYEIIKLLQENYKVGYMGDGINDAPALKIANVALAVDDAADIAREAADIILLHRSLKVVVDGIEEGRIIFANTLKYIKITLAAGFGHFYALAIASFLIDFLPMLPAQLLVLNFMTDMPLIALSTDTMSEQEICAPQKYDIKGIIIIATVLGLVITTFDFILFALYYRHADAVLQTNWFISCILNELVFALSVRSTVPIYKSKVPSKTLMGLSALVAVATVVLPFTSFGQKWLHFVPPTFHDLLIIGLLAGCCFIATEAVKVLYYSFYKSSGN